MMKLNQPNEKIRAVMNEIKYLNEMIVTCQMSLRVLSKDSLDYWILIERLEGFLKRKKEQASKLEALLLEGKKK